MAYLSDLFHYLLSWELWPPYFQKAHPQRQRVGLCFVGMAGLYYYLSSPFLA